MASLVTKINKVKKWRFSTRRFAKQVRYLKKRAHRIDRRRCREAMHTGDGYYTTPQLTDYDII